jgi:GPH family glycoside/pentoside/hexuronide:cation symporter
LVAPPLWTRIARGMGKHNAVRLSAVLYAFAQVGLLVLPRAHPLEMGVALFVVGLIGGAFAFLLRAMVADICDEVRLETGQDRTGLLYALSTSTSKFTSTVSVGAAFGILTLFHFQAAEGAANTASAIGGLELCYVVPPVICVLLGALSLTGYRLDEKRHLDIRAALALKDEAAAVRAAG